MSDTISDYIVLKQGDGLRLQSGPGRDLIFKVTGENTNGALDYFIVEVAPHGGPPLHVHHFQEETIHVLKGRFKIRIGDSIFYLNEGDFAYLPSKVPHAFLNLTDEGGEVIVVYTPGGGHKFYEELGPISRTPGVERQQIAAVFEKHGMSLLGAPLTPD
jgi:quercetin dioxygenase-like cupin family protein